jgi:hypothetical protein
MLLLQLLLLSACLAQLDAVNLPRQVGARTLVSSFLLRGYLSTSE